MCATTVEAELYLFTGGSGSELWGDACNSRHGAFAAFVEFASYRPKLLEFCCCWHHSFIHSFIHSCLSVAASQLYLLLCTINVECNSDYRPSVQNDESLRGHCTNERGVRKWDKKVRRDVI